MKVRLQDIVKYCENKDYCTNCRYCKNGECFVKINGYIPGMLSDYVAICDDSPELAKALYTNEEVELYENDSERTD